MPDAVQDKQTVTPAGESTRQLPAGVRLHDVVTHVDERGSVCEMFDPRWKWHDHPVEFVYMFTVRPGVVKGWGLHKLHEDRYFILAGEMEVVLYDERPDSPTKGLLAKVVMSHYRRQLLNIPAGIWHADHNLGTTDAIMVNFPTIKYDHANPDKYRLPIDTDRIPHKFPGKFGG